MRKYSGSRYGTRFILLAVLATLLIVVLTNSQLDASTTFTETLQNESSALAPATWAFEETFDGDPAAPSQTLLPQSFDYVVTHRTHPSSHFDEFGTYPADHGEDCAGPDPAISPLPQHLVQTSHLSRGEAPDDSFFICKNHMMSSMGQVSGYSVTSFWPRQAFDFSEGGVLEFDVNINGGHPRSWWEIMIAPRSQLKVGAAHHNVAIDETYSKEHIVFNFNENKRRVQIGTGALAPEGIIVDQRDWRVWENIFPSDPANTDRRIRRTMRITFAAEQITWSIEKEDGTFDDYTVDVPGGLPFTQGLVLFKTHAYTPEKAGNFDVYTFHWDNIRFPGPVSGRYEAYEANDVVYLQANGNRAIGEQETVTIDLPHIGPNPVLFGQVHRPKEGQVLLSINGGPQLSVAPYDYDPVLCSVNGWNSFQLPLDASWLVEGLNTFTWTIGPRPDCAEDWLWDGFSIRSLEVQFDLSEPSPAATATNTPVVTATALPPTTSTPAATATSPAILADITIDAAGPGTPVDPHLLGSNVPAWLNPTRLGDSRFQTRSVAAGLSIVRMPGGSWSNWYDWLACERDGQGIDADAVCYWPWAATPSDFITYLKATGLDGMYTINMNGTAKEAAALVAFFNGSVADDTSIGVDVRGRDWSKVSDWAQLRADHGNPEPLHIAYWEIGNEIYGGKSGKDCVSWGWEEVWTCDGTEYVTGIGSGVDRREGYLEFRDAMRAVDPTIKVGAVGIPFQADWSNWGNEVIAAAGDVMDFYVIHHYGYFDPPASQAEALALPQQTWAQIMPDVRAAFDQHAGGREVPVAITEYNLFSVQERDSGDWMSRAVNGLYLADNLGQMMVHGVTMANQWDIAHGEGAANPGYGLMQADTYFASPQYYALALWSRFGNIKLPVSSEFSAADTLSVYGGRVDDNTVSVLAINKTGDSVAATIQLDGISTISGATLDIMQANSLDDLAVTFNGVANPADDLSNAPSINLPISGNPIAHTFAPYSVTLLRLEVESTTPTATAVPPTATTITPTETPVITPAPTGTPVFTPEAAIMMPIITSAENSGNEP